jgi:hypothetical protein
MDHGGPAEHACAGEQDSTECVTDHLDVSSAYGMQNGANFLHILTLMVILSINMRKIDNLP